MSARKLFALAIPLVGVVGTSGCFDPPPQEGVFQCDPVNIMEDCPDDFLGCRANPPLHTDFRCYRTPNDGTDAGIDAFIAPDASGDAPGDAFVGPDAAMDAPDAPMMGDAGGCAGDTRLGQDCTPANVCQVGAYECVGGVVRCVGQVDGTIPLVRDATFTCRPAAGPCDAADHCNGSALGCPTDDFLPSSMVCRAAVNSCDVAEMCTGSASACPTDALYTAGHACGAGMFCGADGVCGTCPDGDPCDDPAHVCSVGTISCASGSPVCGTFRPRSNGTVCNASLGACDPAETCNGTSLDCPAEILDTTTVCRPAVSGGCDILEVCNQAVSARCPDDAYATSSVLCRPASASGCDMAEMCTGGSPTCPTDMFAIGGTPCRAGMGMCDGPEVCSGISATCPPLVVTMCDAGMDAFVSPDAFTPVDAGNDAGRDAFVSATDAFDAFDAFDAREVGVLMPDASGPDAGPPVCGALRLFYHFDEGMGSTMAMDSSGCGNHGTINGAVPGSPGRFGNSYRFSTVSGATNVTAPDSPSLSTFTQVTVEAWVNQAPGAAGGNIVRQANAGTGGPFSFGTRNTASPGVLTFGYGAPPACTGSGGEASPPLSSSLMGAWNHIAVSYDGTTIRWYRNGALAGFAVLAFSLFCDDAVQSVIGGGWNGAIDELRIWSVARSDSEICSDAGGTPGAGGTCAIL